MSQAYLVVPESKEVVKTTTTHNYVSMSRRHKSQLKELPVDKSRKIEQQQPKCSIGLQPNV